MILRVAASEPSSGRHLMVLSMRRFAEHGGSIRRSRLAEEFSEAGSQERKDQKRNTESERAARMAVLPSTFPN